MTKAKDLSDALYNALQFSKKAVAVTVSPEGTWFSGYDGFTFCVTRLDYYADNQEVYFIPIAEAKDLQKRMAELKDDDAPAWAVSKTDDGDISEEDHAELLLMVKEVQKNESAGLPAKFGNIAFSPDRFRKLSLLKPSGLPIDLSFESDNGQAYAGFKYGKNTWGLLSFLDRDVIKEEMGAEYVW